MKLCWILLTNTHKLWVKILRSKYKCSNTTIPMIQKPKGSSYIWRSICAVWEEFTEGLGWRIGKGDQAAFWLDKWSPLPRPLIFYANNVDHISHQRVRDFSTGSGTWDRERLSFYLPQDITRRILLVKAPNTYSPEDSLCWRPSNDGLFSVKSAYHFLGTSSSAPRSSLWRKIWRWPTYEKIKFFLWKLAWNRLPNYISDSACPFGCPRANSPLHIIRDCSVARQVWLKILNPSLSTHFFSLSLQDWLLWNERMNAGHTSIQRLSWKAIFAQTSWLLWKNGCTKFFSPYQHKEVDLAFLSLRIVREDSKLQIWNRKLGTSTMHEKMSWSPPDTGWARLDVDGSVDHLGEAACGGLIRDDKGRWISGFARKLGFLPVMAAELHGIREGLTLCWSKGLKQIQLFSDSQEALDSIVSVTNRHHPLFDIVEDIRRLLMRDWDVSYAHVFREANRCADCLAHLAHSLRDDPHILHVPPDECIDLMHRDWSVWKASNSPPCVSPP